MELKDMTIGELEHVPVLMTALTPVPREVFYEISRRIKEAEAREAVMVEALEKIEEYDRHSMYERCPDCDYPKLCSRETGCKMCRHSTAGKMAQEAISIASPRAKQILAIPEEMERTSSLFDKP